MGVAIRAGLLTATPEIEEQTRQELGLPPLPDAARRAWEATGGIRQPITLKAAESEAVNEALDVDSASAPMSDTAPQDKRKTELADALEEWLGPMADSIERAAGLDDDKLDALLRSGEIAKPGDSSKFEDLMRNEMERPFHELENRNK